MAHDPRTRAAEVAPEACPVDPVADDVGRHVGEQESRAAARVVALRGIQEEIQDPRVGLIAQRARGRVDVATRARREVRRP